MSYELHKSPRRKLIPFENDDQRAVFEWAERQVEEKRYSELCLMYLLPHATRWSFLLMGYFERATNIAAPDICLPVPKGGFGALYIELRHASAARRRPDENDFVHGLRAFGNAALTVYGADEAIAVIRSYLDELPLAGFDDPAQS